MSIWRKPMRPCKLSTERHPRSTRGSKPGPSCCEICQDEHIVNKFTFMAIVRHPYPE